VKNTRQNKKLGAFPWLFLIQKSETNEVKTRSHPG
jgi:hypothetical protein